MIESIDSKLISVCLINDYSLIADLHIFVHGSAECSIISLECTTVKLLILNNFGGTNNIWVDCKPASKSNFKHLDHQPLGRYIHFYLDFFYNKQKDNSFIEKKHTYDYLY